MILDEVIKLQSRGLLEYHSKSKVSYELDGSFHKEGASLKVGDRFYDEESVGTSIAVVKEILYETEVAKLELRQGEKYDLLLPREKGKRKFWLQEADPEIDFYHFVPVERSGVGDISGTYASLPPVFMEDRGRSDPSGIEVAIKDQRKTLSYDSVKKKSFRLDLSSTHVVLAIG